MLKPFEFVRTGELGSGQRPIADAYDADSVPG